VKTAIFITARLGSTRLKRKHLLKVNGKPILEYQLGRIRREFARELGNQDAVLAIVTSDEPENKDLEQVTGDDATLFSGSTHNIPLRHLQAAHHSGVDAIVSIDGDDLLCSPRGIRSVFDSLRAGSKYAKTVGLPFGMNSFGYTASFLQACLSGRESDVLETGWGRIFESAAPLIKEFAPVVDQDLLRFTLDYSQDFDFFRAVISALGDRAYVATDEEIIKLVVSQRLFLINADLHAEYWREFHGNVDKETVASLRR